MKYRIVTDVTPDMSAVDLINYIANDLKGELRRAKFTGDAIEVALDFATREAAEAALDAHEQAVDPDRIEIVVDETDTDLDNWKPIPAAQFVEKIWHIGTNNRHTNAITMVADDHDRVFLVTEVKHKEDPSTSFDAPLLNVSLTDDGKIISFVRTDVEGVNVNG